MSDRVLLRAFCPCGRSVGRLVKEADEIVWQNTIHEVSHTATAASGGVTRIKLFRANVVRPADPGTDEVFATCSSGHKLVADLGLLAASALAGRSRATLAELPK